MAISNSRLCAAGRKILIGICLLLSTSAALAASAFISGASVERDGDSASISVILACQVRYLGHAPTNRAAVFRIQLESTTACKGVPPSVANLQEYYLPSRAADANLTSIEYDGTSFGSQILTLSFSKSVSLSVVSDAIDDRLRIVANFGQPVAKKTASRTVTGQRVQRPAPLKPVFVINLESARRPPATADNPDLVMAVDHKVYFSTVQIDGQTVYRIRLGFFDTEDAAAAQLEAVRFKYPGAWVDQASQAEIREHRPLGAAAGSKPPGSIRPRSNSTGSTATARAADVASQSTVTTRAPVSAEKLESLMSDGRTAMVEGRLSQAAQIYTKVLQYPEHAYMPEAQEYLALAREKNGQTAHARAEYQRYLALYGDSEGAERVSQRLAALIANTRASSVLVTGDAATPRQRTVRQTSPWRTQTYFSQYYRRDVNQIGDNDDVTSQSSLFSDVNFDTRRRGERFDFGARLSAGYRYDLLDEEIGTGNETRISYAYADLADSRIGLRGRVGRQSRNDGGILGRFDGLNVGYQVTERTLLSAAVGKPVNSSSDGVDGPRSFYGVSANFGPIADNLDVGGFYVRQSVDGLKDREAVGAEIRYFDSKRSLWALLDYDTLYKELGSAFLQGTWRFDSQLSINAQVDRRYSPFLSTSNALIGQPFETISSLSGAFTEEQLRQLSLDRSAITSTYTVGASYPLGPRFQINGNVTRSSVSSTRESGGVAATPSSDYRYYGTNLVASSLFREGDVTVFGVRYSQSGSADVASFNLDTRFPITRSFYINPRLRVDRRDLLSGTGTEWTYTPGLRLRYRIGRKIRILFEAGKQFVDRDNVGINVDRESFFFNLGYQAFF